jgi:hypothetical protein
MYLTYYSAYLLLAPCLYYLVCHEAKTWMKTMLLAFIFVNFVMSIQFWKAPVRRSFIHRLDGFFAKWSIGMLTTYIAHRLSLSVELVVFGWVIALMLIFFCLSHKYSNVQWCSEDHVFVHATAHVFSVIALFFLFIER